MRSLDGQMFFTPAQLAASEDPQPPRLCFAFAFDHFSIDGACSERGVMDPYGYVVDGADCGKSLRRLGRTNRVYRMRESWRCDYGMVVVLDVSGAGISY